MSSRQKNSRRRQISKLDGEQIVRVLKFIGAMAGAMLIMCLLGMILAPKTPETMVVYTIVAIVNVITLIASLVIPHFMLKKLKKLDEDKVK